MKHTLIFDKEQCIGSFACTLAYAKRFKQGQDGKAELQGAAYNEETQDYRIHVSDEDLAAAEEAVANCPVAAIRLEKKEH